MPNYKYVAKNIKGKNVRGKMVAPDEDTLYHSLRADNLFLVEAKFTNQAGSGRSVVLKRQQLSEFCLQLSNLLNAGVVLSRALGILVDEESLKPAQRKVYGDIVLDIRQGVTLSDSMEERGTAFPPLLINMVRSAEINGNMGETLGRMAQHYEKEHRLNAKVRTAMIYPTILIVLLLAVTVFILTFLVPRFQSIFDSLEVLPWPTTVLLAMSNGFKYHWLTIIIVTALVVIVWFIVSRLEPVAIWLDKIKLSIPVIGPLLKKIYTARFARTLSSLYSSGIPVVKALGIAANTIGNKYLESLFPEMIGRVRSGESLSQTLKGAVGFQQKLVAAIAVGEETGRLDEMLITMADSLDADAEKAMERLVALMEPLLIIVMAVLVGFVMIAVILPIYQSYATIDQGY